MMNANLQDKLLTYLDDNYLTNLFQIYKETYQKRQLNLSVFSGKEMQEKYTGLINVEEKVFFVYRTTHFGRKITLLFSKQNFSSKKLLIKHYLDLICQSNWYIEASSVIEEISTKNQLPFIENKEVVERILDKEVQWLDNGYYKRKLSKADTWIIKRMYGNPNLEMNR